ncbi:hypothetical protein CEXT_796801 [Caerostris extrusa]|uniref:Uncharacterized protein n=1 Tax=Caerostris extrusa TaxID=172846 RepID=A0AAV4XDC8_CAEEX|nr:hypothetical protein CEXT_796801 [Caerostris extrusa]
MPHTMICMFYLPRARIDVCRNPPTARFIDLNQILRGWPARTYDWDDPLGGGQTPPRKSGSRGCIVGHCLSPVLHRS